MSDTPEPAATPPTDDKPQKVDEKVQENAGKERAENEGYD
jgi:hypothetical protein